MSEPKAAAMAKLGGRTPGALMTIPEWVYVAQVDLLPEEHVRFAWDAGLQGRWQTAGMGTLYVTNERLVWIRWRTSLPWIANVVEIPLGSVTRVEAHKTRWRILFGPQLVIRRQDEESCVFVTGSFGPGALRMVEEITSILRERGLLRD